MQFPDRFSDLPAYAFPRLRGLLDTHSPGGDVVHMTIGEPKHPFPAFVPDVLAEHVGDFSRYPNNHGIPELLHAIAGWIDQRFGVNVVPETQIMALNGTREGLYDVAMALLPEMRDGQTPFVLMPNPFYQAYAVATLSIGATPVFVPATAETGFLPDYSSVPPEVLNRTTAVYLCSPSNPQGAIASRDYWIDLLALAEKYDLRIFADECYSEIYRHTPPPGGLTMAAEVGADPERVTVFHSLSKRSNLPGLRSGFVASGPQNIARIKQLRDYGGAPLPLPIQHVSARVWQDETHVVENRALYTEKFALADDIFDGVPGYRPPQAGFFLWLPVADSEAAALKLWQSTGVRALPGAYLGRSVDGTNPGAGYLRVALVAPKPETERGLTLLRDCLYQ